MHMFVILATVASLTHAVSRQELLDATEADFLSSIGIFTPFQELVDREAKPCNANEVGGSTSLSSRDVTASIRSLSTTIVPLSTLSFPQSSTTVPEPNVVQATSASTISASREYRLFTGDGSVQAGWPTISDWATFEELWNVNLPLIQNGCSMYGVPANSDAEIAQLKTSIQSVAEMAGIDPRFAFVTAMQETSGCVRGAVTYSPGDNIRNPGIFQSVDGLGSCNDGSLTKPENVKMPCPESQIYQMTLDGINGTLAGDGLKQCLNQAGSASTAQSIYRAARLYNSGQIDKSSALEKGVATHCYASDIANRLCGWTTKTSNLCNLDTTIAS